jgi:DNA-binding XRE family transcriptional regulator
MSANPTYPREETPISRLGVSKGTAETVSEFTKRIEFRMRELGMTKKDLAEKAGISRQSLYSILQLGTEGDPAMPKIKTMLGLANALKMHPFWLVDGLFCNVHIPVSIAEQVQGDRAGYVVDVDYPDGSLVAPGMHFVKTWCIQNLSNEPWPRDSRKLVCWDEEVVVTSKRTGKSLHACGRLLPDAQEIQLEKDIAPGEVFNLKMGFTAPKTNGMVISYWMPVRPDGEPLYNEDSAVWCMVRVSDFADTIAFTPYR